MSGDVKRVGFLISATGGGHKAAADAISAGLEHRYPGRFKFDYIDLFREYTPPPWRYAPEIYPRWVHYNVASYSAFFWSSERLLRSPLGRDAALARIARHRIARLMEDHHPDILVVLHGAFTRFAVAARPALGVSIPIITVITDLAKPHLGWYHPGVDRCLVPCEPAYHRGIAAGVPPEKLRIVGHPAHPKFALYTESKTDARQRLGWDKELPTVLLVGGGEGMGRIADTAVAIDRARLGAHLVVVCGHNEALRTRLSARQWHEPTDVYGFVGNMEVMMRAADVLITKAGPGTIAEAAISGLPMILNGAIPLQESPNIGFVVHNHAGVYAKRPERIVAVLQRWLEDETVRVQYVAGAEKIAYPNAAFTIADEIAAHVAMPQPLRAR